MRTGLKNQQEWEGSRRPPVADAAAAGGPRSVVAETARQTDAMLRGSVQAPRVPPILHTRKFGRFAAFTLVELMAVIVVICILIGALIGVAKYANRQFGVTRAKTQMAALQMALEAYKTDVGYYPVSTWVRCSGNFYAEQSNAACLYRALTRPKCYYRARQTDIGAANGLTFFKDPWGSPWNYYRPALPQPTSLVISNVTGGGFGYAWGGQHNLLTYDLYSYGPDKITSIPGANNGWICADETGAGRETDDIVNWKR